LLSDEFYNDVFGRYYNAEYNGQSDVFKDTTERVDRFRKEKWGDTFPLLKEALQKSSI